MEGWIRFKYSHGKNAASPGRASHLFYCACLIKEAAGAAVRRPEPLRFRSRVYTA